MGTSGRAFLKTLCDVRCAGISGPSRQTVGAHTGRPSSPLPALKAPDSLIPTMDKMSRKILLLYYQISRDCFSQAIAERTKKRAWHAGTVVNSSTCESCPASPNGARIIVSADALFPGYPDSHLECPGIITPAGPTVVIPDIEPPRTGYRAVVPFADRK